MSPDRPDRARTTLHCGARFTDDDVEHLGATVESRETVDRDFGGDWWARMK
jgi:hypothetical protein